MKLTIFAVFGTLLILLTESSASPQITKFSPVEDWITFKRTSDIKPLDKFLGKLRATYDFVFHKPENVSHTESLVPEDKSTGPYKFVLSTSQVADSSSSEKDLLNIMEDIHQDQVTETPVYLELLPDEHPTKESSISRVTDWADDVEPLSELEVLNDNVDDIDGPVETNHHSAYELPYAVARAFLRWLSSIIGFTHGAYLKITNSSSYS